MAKAYGSITIVDITDLGTLSVYPQSNQPQSVIFDPNQNNLYVPDWSAAGNSLVLTPISYYGNTNVTPTITWKKKVGSDDATTTLGTGHTVNPADGKLTVNVNVLNVNNPIITYICSADYTEPQTQTTLHAQGRITFSLIAQPSALKSCSITGESVFLYKSGSNTAVGTGSITLTATVENANITKWQYKNASGTWTDISNSANATLTVLATDTNYFVNDLGIFKVVTDAAGLEDVHTITKIRDGAAGSDTLSASLSNENQMLPANASGTVTSYDDAFTTITVYNGNEDITSQCTITAEPSAGVTGSWDPKPTYKITGLTGETGNVLFTIQYGEKTITQMFSAVKVKAGINGTSPTLYSLETSSLAINKNSSTYTPASVVLKAYSQTGSDAKAAYSGRFKIYIDGSSTATYTSNTNESTYTYNIGSVNSSIKVELYAAGGTSTLLDSQTIVITNDGSDAYNFILGNEAEVIPCNSNRTSSAARTITIPFEAFKGITPVDCTAAITSTVLNGVTTSGLKSGIGLSLSSNTAASSANSYKGSLVLSLSNSGNLGGTTAAYDTGSLIITLTSGSATATKTFTWTKNIQATNGTSYYTFIRYSENANGNPMVETPTASTVYIGTYTGTSSSPAYTQYKWVKYKGEKGEDGTADIVTGDIEIKYQNSTSGTNVPTGTWSDTANPTPGQYIWTRTGITYSISGVKYTYICSYVGANSVLLQITTPKGNTFTNAKGTDTLQLGTLLTDGSSTATATSYKWYKFDGTNYVEIGSASGYSGATTATLTVNNSNVDSYASFRCDAVYGGKTYMAFGALYDKTDPLQIDIISTIGDKIVNNYGVGCVYARVFRNGDELDPLTNLVFSATQPSGTAGKIWAKIDETNKQVVVKEYKNSSWVNYSPTLTYTWTFTDKDGSAVSLNSANSVTSKFVYIDGDLINEKIQLNLQVQD